VDGEQAAQAGVCHYFVDEGGDTTLFGPRGKILVGQEGCSRFFMLGVCSVGNPESLSRQLEALRQELLQDPYFKNVPSMQVDRGKTARFFHAKDDLPEIRREVFALLTRRSDIRFLAIVRDKASLVSYVKQQNETDESYRYDPNGLYDSLVSRLFRDKLHKDDAYRVVFARRGRTDRTRALLTALERARANFERRWGRSAGQGTLSVEPGHPWEHAGLQATDYCLWALQRLFERQEERYFAAIHPLVAVVTDADDRRRRGAGEYYSQKRRLTLEIVKDRNC
jgi:hypothetical protein